MEEWREEHSMVTGASQPSEADERSEGILLLGRALSLCGMSLLLYMPFSWACFALGSR